MPNRLHVNATLIAAACCVLPMALMLVGPGGSWLAVFGKIAAVSPYVAAFSSIALGAAWILAARRKASSKTVTILSVGTTLTILAWIMFLGEAGIDDYLITLM
ncbi:MAG: hypothetical protein AAFY56_21285 [Pseudomonadota bacterium]